jgi:hypothetical protein
VGRQFGRQEDEVTITDFAPNELIEFEANGGAGQVRNSFRFQPDGEGTRLTKVFDVVKPSLTVRLTTPVVMLVAPRGLEEDLRRIKEKVEAQGNGMQQEANA